MTAGTFERTWDWAVTTHAGSTFLVFRDGEGSVSEWTYAEFELIVRRVAGALRTSGVGHRSAVHVALRNCPAFVALWLAAARLGAWIVPVDPASTARELVSQVRRVRPALGVCGAGRGDMYSEAVGDEVPLVIAVTETAADVAAGGTLVSADPSDERVEVSPADRLAVMFTSGTTSEPKGVVLTQANYAHVATTMARAARLEAADRWYVTLPLFHANAQYYCFASAIARGASVAMTLGFSASGWVRQARELAVTHASLFAAPIRMILASTPAEEPGLRLSHVWFAQNLDAEQHERFAELVGVAPRQLYGMTETVAIVCADDALVPRHDVIGSVLPGRRTRVTDTTTGEDVGHGSPGHLHVWGSPGEDLFEGYLDDPASTAAVLDATSEGTWFSTGDLVLVDEQGDYRFAGRIDEVIKVAGENVSLIEVESVLSQAPGVFEAAVVAQEDAVRDVVPVAYVVPGEPDQPPEARALADWAVRNLSPAARPVEWHILSALPRTSVGKIRRAHLQTLAPAAAGGEGR